MSIAQVHVDADKAAALTVDGATTHHPDLGSAMARLTALARERQEPVSIEIHDSGAVRLLHVDAAGRVALHPAPAAPRPDPAAGPPAPRPETGSPVSGTPTRPDTAPPESAPPVPRPADPPAQGLSEPSDGATPSASDAPEPRPSTAEGYPIGTPYSGPAAPVGRTDRKRAPGRRWAPGTAHRPSSAPRRSRLGGLTVPSLVLAVLLVIALAAYFLPTIIGSPDSAGPQSIPADSQMASEESLTLENSPTPVPGFAAQPAWEAAVPATASVTATGRGVLVVDGNRLSVLDPTTGQPRYETDIETSIGFAVDTEIDGERALLWRTGDSAHALFDGDSTTIDYRIPANARMSSAGTNVLVKDGNSLSTFTREGLTEIPTPDPGYTPMALDGTTLISAEFGGAVTLTDIDEVSTSELLLETPADDLEIFRWVTAGHGKIVSLWGEAGATTTSGHRVQLVVHSAEDGRIASTVSTTTDAVGEETWVRGQGYRLAVIGPYLFTIDDGLLVRNGAPDHLRMTEPRGEIVPTTIDDTRYLLRTNTVWRSGADLLAVTDTGGHAVIRQSADRVVGLPAE